jgi:hypothetical protein
MPTLGWSEVPKHIRVALKLDKIAGRIPFYTCLGKTFDNAPQTCTESSGKIVLYTGVHTQLIRPCKAHLKFYQMFSWFEEYE